jgi:hypothetical protein
MGVTDPRSFPSSCILPHRGRTMCAESVEEGYPEKGVLWLPMPIKP